MRELLHILKEYISVIISAIITFSVLYWVGYLLVDIFLSEIVRSFCGHFDMAIFCGGK